MKSIFIIAICTFSSLLTLLHAQNPYDLRQEALLDFNAGKSKEAQKKLIQAYDIFYSEANWDMASMCLYERAIDYMNVGD